MKRFISLLFILVAMGLSTASYAGNCNGGFQVNADSCNEVTDNSVTNKGGNGGAGGTGIGVGVGIGKGGSASSRQHQSQGQGQSQFGLNKSKNSITNKGPQVVIEGDEVAASSAYAPNVGTSQLQVDCPLFVQGSISAGGSAVAGSGSLGFTDTDAVPECFAYLAAQQSDGEASAYAYMTGYCLSMERAKVTPPLCKDWRRVVELGFADYTPLAIEKGAFKSNGATVTRD